MLSQQASGVRLVGFEVSSGRYALPIDCVREIIRPMPLQPLPNAPKMVVGVVDHREEIVPLIDLRVRFEVPEPFQDDAHWIIVRSNEHTFGIVVDRVNEVFGARAEEARVVPELGDSAQQRGITGAYLHRNRLVFVVDVAHITHVASAFATSSSRPRPL